MPSAPNCPVRSTREPWKQARACRLGADRRQTRNKRGSRTTGRVAFTLAGRSRVTRVIRKLSVAKPTYRANLTRKPLDAVSFLPTRSSTNTYQRGPSPFSVHDRSNHSQLEKRSGQPCVRGLRITVWDVLSWLAAGMTQQEILDDYPELEPVIFPPYMTSPPIWAGVSLCEAAFRRKPFAQACGSAVWTVSGFSPCGRVRFA